MITDVDRDIDMDMDMDMDMDTDMDTDMNSDMDPDMHCRAGGGGCDSLGGGGCALRTRAFPLYPPLVKNIIWMRKNKEFCQILK